MSWLVDTFRVQKPVIGMCHLQAMPGDTGYDKKGGLDKIIELAKADLAALQEGGVDGVLISNEFSLPYLTKTEPITAIVMARIIGELRSEINTPYGVNVLWDATASIDLAVATGAAFVREIFTGVYASDFGLWDTNVGQVARHRNAVSGENVKLLYNVVPEAASYVGSRSVEEITKSTVFNCQPDGLCVSGLTAGAATDSSVLAKVKENAGNTAVFVNTGVTDKTVVELLSIADAAIVGTYFKRDGIFENATDSKRVEKLMTEVRQMRSGF
ncbi:BtpA/SgcQ family protein [Candidatus Aquiluna sp. IMCC13023]|jgi:membrane complex biogenesis BtpA family protein|uniref:BtpA/SgcQ family protein n=1 Tax=Candidatus Aquiluna sp. IMCC13023 TaxID=1081644 RepID=UPI0002D80420|nr:BtpA/SgcQ family protein [Candidatus Aquiluna sp. IMCC13023]